MPDPWLGDERPCLRGAAECSGTAEPEEDDGLRYWACGECGYQFGFELVKQDEDSCALGVPTALQDRGPRQPQAAGQTFLGAIGRRPS
jgi:hypothetical protein